MRKSIFLNKKGESEEQGFSIFYLGMAIIVFAVMAFILLFIIGQYIESFLVYDTDVAKNVYAYRAINTCLAYQDPFTNRYYPGIIDLSKYTQENLNNCYADTIAVSFNVQLVSLTGEKTYDRILVGFGAARTIGRYPVLIRNSNGRVVQGELLFGTSDEAMMKSRS